MWNYWYNERARRLKRRIMGEPPVRYQIIGERCSGTNFVSALIDQNFTMRETRGTRWKHGFPNFMVAPQDVVFVVIFREVFGWLASMYGKPWHTVDEIQSLDFSDFI